MKRTTLVVLSGVFIALAVAGAAFTSEAAPFVFGSRPEAGVSAVAARIPAPVGLRHVEGRGFMVRAWLNGRGPYTLVVDTGAGMTVLSNSVAREVGLQMAGGRGTVVAGLSGRELMVGKGTIERIALGYPENRLPRPVSVALAPRLPDGVDGILDPSDAYSPLGFTIDLPGQLLSALDPETEGLKLQQQPVDGAVVPWLRDGYSRRPFVRLSDGRLALIDTGSNFGLAIARAARRSSERARVSSDLGGGVIHATRVEPSNISIGSLELHGVPTDFLDGVEKGAPIILGRDALYPFKMRFDPIRKLIEIAPSRN